MPERTQGWGKLLVQSTRQAMTLQKKKNTNSEQRTEICAKEWNVFIEEKVISPVVVCEDH